MGVVTRAKKRRLEEEDRISSLPDGVLGDIVSFLPTKDGARTQVLSSRWRHLWRSAPLNLDLETIPVVISASTISGILSAHPGPGRRLVMPRRYTVSFYDPHTAATLDAWLRSPALDSLQELEFHSGLQPVPASLHRFSSTLRIASFSGLSCGFGNNNGGSTLRFPVLRQMTLSNVSISESSLLVLLAGCPVLESLLLDELVHPRLQIVSPSLKSVGVLFSRTGQASALVIEDAPCLERLLYFAGTQMDISVIYAPRLVILGDLCGCYQAHRLETTFFQGSTVVSMTAVLPSVKVLSLSDVKICLDAAINLLKCFPNLERLYIKAQTTVSSKDVSYSKCQKNIDTLDIRVRTIVLVNYEGERSHINFIKLFILNSRALESLRLAIGVNNATDVWIARQHKLLHIKKRASRAAQIDFVSPTIFGPPDDLLVAKHVHDPSTDPFLNVSVGGLMPCGFQAG